MRFTSLSKPLVLILGAIATFAVSAAAASAQSMPNQNKNRVACESIAALKTLIMGMPSARSIENQAYDTDPPIQGCTWIKGAGYLPASFIGEPLGWIFPDPYTVAVHIVMVQGQPMYHPSVIEPQQTTRMQPRCDFFSPFNFSAKWRETKISRRKR